MSIAARSAYNRGFDAYKRNNARNPFARGTENFLQWNEGMEHARIDEDATELYLRSQLDKLS